MNRPWRMLCIGLTVAGLLLPSSAPARTYAYIPSYGDDSMVRIDIANATFSSIVLASHPYGAAVQPSGTYILATLTDNNPASTDGDRLVRITNANFNASGTPLSISVGNEPRGVAINSTGDLAYVANYSDGTVSEIDVGSFTVSTTISVGNGPMGVAAFYNEYTEETIVYVANSLDGTLSVIRNGVLDRNVDVGVNPIGLALSPDGARLYISDNNQGNTGNLIIMRTSDMTLLQTLPLTRGPWGVAVGSDGDKVYITANQNISPGTVSIYTPSDGSLVSIEVAAISLTGIAAPKNGAYAYAVSQGDNQIFHIRADASSAETVGNDEISAAYALGSFVGGTPPASPGNLSGEAVDYDTITLTWTDNAADELGYKIERREQGQQMYTQVAVISADSETYTDSGLNQLTTYEYRIRAYNEVADSAYITLTDGVTTLEGRFSWCFISTILH